MGVFSGDGTIISEIINRILNCRGLKDLYVIGEPEGELEYLYPSIRVIRAVCREDLAGDVFYIHITSRDGLERILPWVIAGKEEKDFVVYISPGVEISGGDMFPPDMEVLGMPHNLCRYSGLPGVLYLAGKSFGTPRETAVPNDFKVLAVIHFYNEADILGRTIEYLLAQDIDLYLADNWSEDGSYEIARKYREAYPGRIYLERFPRSGKSDHYEWYKQLDRTEEISREKDYNWYIHYDADEMRVSPWENTTLREAIWWIDRQGYNCIENTVTDFRFTVGDESDIFMEDTFFDFRHRKKIFDQLKTWKKSRQLDLKSSAGHFVHVEDPKVYPLKFLNRHYPLRSLEQAEKKVFKDRLPRFAKERGERGWHGHYDGFHKTEDFVFDASGLLHWRADTFRELYIPLFLECGLRWDSDEDLTEVELPNIENRKIILYGAGNIGRKLYPELRKKNQIVLWTDKQYGQLPAMFCEKVASPQEISGAEYDYLVLAVKKEKLVCEITKELTDIYGVAGEKVLCIHDKGWRGLENGEGNGKW